MKVKLNEICSSITDGDHQPPPKTGCGIPFITISNIDQPTHTLDFTDTAFVSMEYYRSLAEERRARKNDVLYSAVGSFGIPVLVKDDKRFVFQRHIAILRPNDKVIPEYLFYSMMNPSFYHWADNVAIGAAQRTVTLTQLRNKEIELPALLEQRRIAGILSAYDELIENNRKQIKLLEEAAQRLYKEWFIDFKFPGHDATTIDSASGLPKGWERKPFLFEVSFIRGKSYTTIDLSDNGDNLLVNLGNIQPFGGYRAGKEKGYLGEINVSQRIRTHDLIMAVTEQAEGLAGYVALVPTLRKPAVISMDLVKLIPKSLPGSYIYASLRFGGLSHVISSLANGAKIKHLKLNELSNVSIVFPDYKTAGQFDDKIAALQKQKDLSLRRIEYAQEARDRLLPKLMSGEIEV